MRLPYVIILVLISVVLLYALFGSTSLEEGDFNTMGPRFVGLIAMLLAIGAGVFAARPHMSEVIKSVLFWGGLFLLLIVGYAFKDDMLYVANRTIGALIPGYVVSGTESVSVNRSPDGHFYLNVDIEGERLRFLVDTGASITAISAFDAARLGYNPNQLNYLRPVNTANGRTHVAPIEIESLQIGEFRINGIDAAAFPPGTLFENLLGMDVIGEFQSWRVEGDRLILVP